MKSQVCHLPHESPRRALTQNSQPRVAISVIKQHRFAGVGGSLEQATRQKSRKLWGLERGLRKEQVLLGGGSPQAGGCPGPLLKKVVVAGSLLVGGRGTCQRA